MPPVDVSVITPTIPGREALLQEAVESVAKQETALVIEHLIGLDSDHEGPSVVRNRLAAEAQGDWLAFLDDDDLMYPDHIQTLWSAAFRSDADVCWSLCDFSGVDNPLFIHECDPSVLPQRNFIPVTALVRAMMFGRVRGFPERQGPVFEDWGLWLAILQKGGKFQCVHETTWVYRILGNNRVFT